MADFEYYYGTDAEQFNFFRLPKKLVRDKAFSNMNSDAKILYGVLLDRMTLSQKNKWLDAENRIYIIYTVNDVAEEFCCSRRKAIMLMNELADAGLIERRRQGLGRPNLIYVKNFNKVQEETSVKEKTEERTDLEPKKAAEESSPISSLSHTAFQEVQKSAPQEVQKPASQEVQKFAPQEVQGAAPLEVQNSAHQEVQEAAPKRKTEKNDTENIYNNLSISPSEYEDGWRDRNLVLRILKKRTGYSILVHDLPEEKQQIDEIISLMADVCCSPAGIIINGCEVPADVVREQFMRITSEHIRYVLVCLSKTTSDIRNIRAYLLTCIYNAPRTIHSFYRSQVQHDMAIGEDKY